MKRDVINRLTGWTPVIMSAAAVSLTIVVVKSGWERDLKDEGAAAHIWQRLVLLQAPWILAFLMAAKWDRMRRVVGGFALQLAGWALALAPVLIFHLQDG